MLFTEKGGTHQRLHRRDRPHLHRPTRRRPVDRRGRDDGPRRRPAVRHQPTHLHVLPLHSASGPARRRPRRPLDASTPGYTALERPHRHRHRAAGEPEPDRPPLRAAARASGPTATSGSAPATRRSAPNPQNQTSLGGKVLRVDRDGAGGAPGQHPAARFAAADLHLRPPQRAGHRLPAPRRPGVLRRARHRLRRRGQPARRRGQLRLGSRSPGTTSPVP